MSSVHHRKRYTSRSRSRERTLDRKREKSRDRRDRSEDKSRKSRHEHHAKEDKKHSSSRHKDKKKSKKHKSKKRSSSESSSSSSSSDSSSNSLKLLQRLEEERQRLKEKRKKEKELLKANETPEEKRARRLREKLEKERKRRERMGWDGEYQCYTNDDNPFGDSALTQTFVWGKKLTKEGVSVASHADLEALNRQKALENKLELEKVKQRRLQREQERAERESEAAAAQRAREAAQYDSWARQEDVFHLQQARLRSQIRIRDGRAKPIDLLAWYVGSEECVDALEMHEPYTYLNGLQQQDLEDLLEDIKVYKEMEDNKNLCYWEDVTIIVTDELGKLKRVAGSEANRRDGIHQAVVQDVTQVFKGKTGAQLEALKTQIEEKISGKRDGVDIGYWESLLSQLKAHMARARLRDRHQTNLRRKLELLKQEQGVAGVAGETSNENVKVEQVQNAGESQTEDAAPEHGDSSSESENDEANQQVLDDEEACVKAYEQGRYSPALLIPDTVEAGVLLLNEQEDTERLDFLRSRHHAAIAAQTHSSQIGSSTSQVRTDDASLVREARRGMGDDEAQFSVEQPLPDQPCLWSDKYRPRKPRYFNRVHTGFEWNKYNQTHYDMDNPPPKIVQGYKFNIFYPDLIDKNSTPEFTLKPCPDNPDFAVVRFHAGPPYEDIAFKIVNREWEYSYKRGFRCHFHNNIFQLWFHFKRYRYRR